MSNVTKIRPKNRESEESANDLLCKKYIKLNNEISELRKKLRKLEKELKPIKDDFKHRGSFSTRHYVVTIEKYIQAAYEVDSMEITRCSVKPKGEN